MKRMGILALQGGFEAHRIALERLGQDSFTVRNRDDLDQAEALIIPGGESTVMIRMLGQLNLLEPLTARINEGLAVFGTCAGMILLSRGICDRDQQTLRVMDYQVLRNAYGSQVESFEAELFWKNPSTGGAESSISGIFIRAPRITHIGADVEVLITFENHPVLVRQENCLAASFHPELTSSGAVHRYFLEQIVG